MTTNGANLKMYALYIFMAMTAISATAVAPGADRRLGAPSAGSGRHAAPIAPADDTACGEPRNSLR
ncbi:MAG: hypothetical protein ACM3QY_15135, partial [Candidatus Levyibacteriota bacterium]